MTAYPDAYPTGLPIGDRWVYCAQTVPVIFPFDGSIVAQAPVGNTALASKALDEAQGVAKEIERLSTGTKRSILLAVHDKISEHREELENLLVLETGKPLVDCRVEVARTLTTWAAAAEEVAHLRGETVPLDLQASGDGMIGYWTRKPAGIVIGIAGFNYPLLLASHKLAPALAAGCPIIIKPAPNTPLATLWAVHLIREALTQHQVSTAAVQLVTGGIDVGETLVSDPRSAVVSFTGSAVVGHQIAKNAAPRKAVLELGSNTGFIVAEDADIHAAVDAVLRGGFYANGQACISVQRVLLDEKIADLFKDELLARISEIVVGDPRSEHTRVAPLINKASTDRVLSWIGRAKQRGAQVLAGGDLLGESIQPTIVTEVPDDAELWCEEIFGPVICLRSVPDLETALELVNSSRYGLQAAIFSNSLKTAFRAIDELEVGGVVVNEIPGFRSDIMPYGGVKDSGIGREGPRFAMEEFTVTRMAIIRP